MQRMKFRGFHLYYENRDAAESMVRQIDEFPSFFTPRTERPTVIDGGANIGVSMMEWKTRWPGSQVICFEPDPHAFRILQTNVEKNDIPGVRCVQAALSDHDGQAALYGDIGSGSDARGNSIDPAWGERGQSGQTIVDCQRLSRWMAAEEIAFVKLDIEGAEQRVLSEAGKQLSRVRAMYVEIHETRHSIAYNSAIAIEGLLTRAGFTVQRQQRYAAHALPAHLDRWRRAVTARQSHLLAWR